METTILGLSICDSTYVLGEVRGVGVLSPIGPWA